jgi:hypothetical protein
MEGTSAWTLRIRWKSPCGGTGLLCIGPEHDMILGCSALLHSNYAPAGVLICCVTLVLVTGLVRN